MRSTEKSYSAISVSTLISALTLLSILISTSSMLKFVSESDISIESLSCVLYLLSTCLVDGVDDPDDELDGDDLRCFEDPDGTYDGKLVKRY